MDKNETERLIQRCQSGDAAAFDMLLRSHYSSIFKIAYKWTGDKHHAEDITQNSCLKLARAIRSFRFESLFSSWLYRLVVNCAKDYMRRSLSQKESDLDNSTRLLEAQQDQGDSTSERQIYFQEVLSFIDSMPRDLRDTLVLIFVVGMNHREASLELGVKESTVSWRVHEARKVLRQKFDSTTHLSSQTPAVGELL